MVSPPMMRLSAAEYAHAMFKWVTVSGLALGIRSSGLVFNALAPRQVHHWTGGQVDGRLHQEKDETIVRQHLGTARRRDVW